MSETNILIIKYILRAWTVTGLLLFTKSLDQHNMSNKKKTLLFIAGGPVAWTAWLSDYTNWDDNFALCLLRIVIVLASVGFVMPFILF